MIEVIFSLECVFVWTLFFLLLNSVPVLRFCVIIERVTGAKIKPVLVHSDNRLVLFENLLR
jgi:hypothetical protein